MPLGFRILYFRTRRKGGEFPSPFPSGLKTKVFSPKIFPVTVAQLVKASLFFCIFSSQATLGQVSTSMGDPPKRFFGRNFLNFKDKDLKFEI